MKQLTAILLGVYALASCQPTTSSTPAGQASNEAATVATRPVAATVAAPATEATAPVADSADAEYATYYVVVADTSASYAALHRKMVGLNRKFSIDIDTMGRYFDTAKNRIILPDTSSDEMYAGDYFLPRFPAHSLSLEYLDAYQPAAGKNTMALVTGIYAQEATADSALAVLRPASRNVFKIKSNLFIGCMH